MLNHADNELMCRVGPGTGMGETMRRFWMPALQSSELPEPGGDPKPVELLGERFVAYRDVQGRVGFYDEACAHRGASMLLARAEPDGLRCIYHGWKFATDGAVLEVPNVADPRYKERIRGRTHPVREAGGLIWVYLGPTDKMPEFPKWPWMDLPARHRINAFALVSCSYVQVIEGLVDSSHLTVLHASGLAKTTGSDLDFAKKTTHMQFDAAPKIEADDTDFGFHYVAMRPMGEKVMARVASFIAPCFVANPNGDLWFAVVPENDGRARFYHVWWNTKEPIGEEPMRSRQLSFVGLDDDTLDAFGLSPRSVDGPNFPRWENGYKLDRAAQRAGHFSGLVNFTQEDAVCSISSGAVRDRSRELLCSADIAIARLYRTLLGAVKKQREGQVPTGLEVDTSKIIGTSGAIAADQDWRTLVPDHRITSGRAEGVAAG